MKRHVLHLGKIAISVTLMLSLLWLLVFKDKVDAAITNSYIANYDIKADRDKILGTFVEIDANDKIWTSISTSKFADLNTKRLQGIFFFFQDFIF